MISRKNPCTTAQDRDAAADMRRIDLRDQGCHDRGWQREFASQRLETGNERRYAARRKRKDRIGYRLRQHR
ncbi:hypothetical protein [Niveibacterium umoris]|uniref:Uncharacterized protein n=1 Tax=Niveibacterium umoris TaxID=1193620 RepID=A0A840BHM5_9RHOO|nr:hypothetical protein [Niveibacterium umoris]MBB4012143.1 hypothetical protein [Niveibacterium umoris]